MPGRPSAISIVVLAASPEARARWAVLHTAAVVRVRPWGPRRMPASAVIVDLLDAADAVAVAGDIALHPGEALVLLAAEDQAQPLREAGFDAVVTSPELAILQAVTAAATAALHDGPIQSLTVARMRLSLAAARSDSGEADLRELDDALSQAAEELAGVLDALRVASVNPGYASTETCARR